MSRTKLAVAGHTNCCGANILLPRIERETTQGEYDAKTYSFKNVTKLRFAWPNNADELREVFSQGFNIRANSYVNFLFVPTEFCDLMAARAAKSKHWKRVGKSTEGECWIYGREHADVG